MAEIAAVTKSNKQENQDCFSKISNPKLQIYGVVVADGIGSFSHAKDAARIVTSSVSYSINQLEDINELNFEIIFSEAKNKLIEFAREKGLVTEGKALGTTLIVAVHHPTPNRSYDTIKVAYVGNGAIWHLRGNFNHFNESQLLPWNALNYLNPHSIQEGGKEALYKLISVSDNMNEAIPSVLTFRADNHFGDIIMICTDGIYSYDQIQIGKDSLGRTWISGEKSMSLFYSELNDYFKVGKTDLENFLHNYLQKLNEMEELDDDATIAVFITDNAIAHQKRTQNEGDYS